MKKVFSILIILATLLLASSCGDKNRKYDEAEVKAAAEVLIRKSKKLNDVFWGAGIPYVEDDSYKNGPYYPADLKALSELGVKTVDDIMEKTCEVFSKEYSDSIYESVFMAKAGDYGMAGYTRYYQDVDIIMVYTRYTPLLVDEIEYLYDSISVLGSKGDIVTVKITVNVTRDGDTQTRDIKINLVEEKSGWRIDSPTYAGYRTAEIPE